MRERVVSLLIALLVAAGSFAAALQPVHLTCEYISQPINIDVPAPRFGWQIVSAERDGDYQTAYRIRVSSSLKLLKKGRADVWDSGKVSSDQCNNIPYTGKTLQSSTRYYWQVCIYTRKHGASQWSEPTWFETALLSPDLMRQAQWIGDGSRDPENVEDLYKDDPAPIFRRVCQLSDKAISSARLYVSGLGYYEASLNGQRVGDAVLEPAWTAYDERVLYSVYDVTSSLHQGGNVLAVTVGNGFYNPMPLANFIQLRKGLTIGRPRLWAILRVCYVDGSVQEIPTDASWKVLYSPIVRNSVYLGERYDARQEIQGLESASFDDSHCPSATPTEGPKGQMRTEMQPPVKVQEVIRPKRMTESRPGVFVYDMGENFSGVARLRVKGPRGTHIYLRYGEEVYSDGSLNGMTSVSAQMKRVWDANRSLDGAPQTGWQLDEYILRGDGEEIWQPRFTFHGFRYVEVSGFPGRPDLNALEGVKLHADVAHTGQFQCSDETLNQLAVIINRTFLNNLFGVQSDCPHREKLGYGGDIVATADSYCYLYDMSQYDAAAVGNYREAQRPNGSMTETAPYIGIADFGFGEGTGPIAWQYAFCYMQKKLLDYYGNVQLVRENYDAFRRQVEFLRSQAHDNLISQDNCLGDHEALSDDPLVHSDMSVRCRAVSATAHYYMHLRPISEFATLLGKTDDAARYSQLASAVKQSFIQAFYHPETGIVGNGSQTAQCFGLYYDLVPDGEQQHAFQGLMKSLERADYHIHTGIFGTEIMLKLLSQYGRSDVALLLATRPDFPGWGYMLAKGATTLWETWIDDDNVFSRDHPMFGSIIEWFYGSLLGITPSDYGFRSVTIAPKPAPKLTWAKGTYQSILGPISVDWKQEEDGHQFTLNVTVPFGMKAHIILPSDLTTSDHKCSFDITHGTYSFLAKTKD